MNAAHKIVVLVGSIFLAVGGFVGIIFAIVAEPGKFPLAMLSLPGGFLLIGGGMDVDNFTESISCSSCHIRNYSSFLTDKHIQK